MYVLDRLPQPFHEISCPGYSANLLTLHPQFEGRNMNTRDLMAVQTYMLSLDVGLWSGFKRKMELAESFLCPLVTVSAR